MLDVATLILSHLLQYASLPKMPDVAPKRHRIQVLQWMLEQVQESAGTKNRRSDSFTTAACITFIVKPAITR